MLKLLLKNNLSGVFSRLIGGKKGRKGLMAAVFVLLMAYVIGVMAWLSYQVFGIFAMPLDDGGLGWLYFAFAFVAAFAVTFILSIFAMKNQLYEAKDNDLLLCLPIEPKTVLNSRLLSIGLLNFALGLVIIVPAFIAWAKNCETAIAGMVCAAILYVAMTFFVLALSALFGWVLSLITSRMKRKSLFETLFSLLIIALYFYLYYKASDVIREILKNGDIIAQSLGSVAPVYWVGAASADGVLSCFLYALALFLLPYFIVHKILSATFIRTATTKRGTAKVKYKGGPQKAHSLNAALLRKEAKRFFASSIYTMNAGLGTIFILAASVALLIFRDKLNGFIASFSIVADTVVPVLALGMGFMAGVCVPTCASISIEGKNLWISQSLPVPTFRILMTKLVFSLILYLPALLLNTAVLCILFRPGLVTALLSFLLSIGMILSFSEAGLVINLKLPKLDWQTETQAVKQGASTLVSILTDFALIVLVGYAGYKMLDHGVEMQTVALAAAAFFALLSIALFVWLRRRGTQIYASL